jgi:histidinol-phosphate aminotransferase
MPVEPRPELHHLAEVVHGALDFAELERLGIAPEAIIDFSVNGNPYGASPRVRQAIAGVPVERYPDREALALRRVLAADLDVALEQIIVGNGSSEILWLLALAFLRSDDHVVIVGPTFGEYVQAARLVGARVHDYTAQATAQFGVDANAVTQMLATWQPRLLFLCNPNNPTGTYVSPSIIQTWASDFPATLFLIDEAYLPFVPGGTSVLSGRTANMLVLRSMTKAHALAGLRLGYAVGDPPLIDALQRVRPPWSVNALAQAAGIAAVQDTAHLRWCLEQIAQAKATLTEGLRALQYVPEPSTTHFFLLNVGEAATYRRALLQRGLLVRDCTSFGLPAYVRIATRRPQDNAQLLKALAEIPR